MLEWLETTSWAQAVAQSLMLTASLSALHMLGFTLVTGSALLAGLRLLGVSLAQRPVPEVTRPAGRGIVLGLLVSGITGVLLFSGRAGRVAASDLFQLKMLLLVVATAYHFTWLRRVSLRHADRPALLRATGAVGLGLWLALAGAACAFILFE